MNSVRCCMASGILWLSLLLFVRLGVAETELSNPQDKIPFRMGVFYPSVIQLASRADILVSLNFWTKELVQSSSDGKFSQLQLEDVRLFDDIQVMANAFENREIDMIIAPPFAIAVYFKREWLADCFCPSRGEHKMDAVIAITRADVGSIDELRGKRLLLAGNDELAQVFLHTLTLSTARKPYPQFFTVVNTPINANRMILDVFFKRADIAVVNAGSFEVMQEMNPQLSTQLKVIASYPLRSKTFAFVHKDFPLRQLIIDNYSQMGKTARGMQILNVYQQQALEACSVEELDAFKRYYDNYKKLLTQ